MTLNIAELTAQNAQRWRSAKVIRTGFDPVAKRLVQAKARYQTVTRMTGVPYWVVAVIHEREAAQKWNTQLGQGDPLDRVSTHVPKGRGPFTGPDAWEKGAVDALVNCPPYAARNKDWSAGGTLTLLEQYNGLGYAAKGLPSPYIWSGTDQYKSGKYVADHDFRPDVVDAQLGCAGLLMAMRKLDPTIRFADEAMPPPDVEPAPIPQPSKKPHVAAGTVIAAGTAATTQTTSVAQVLLILAAVAVVVIGIYWFSKKG